MDNLENLERPEIVQSLRQNLYNIQLVDDIISWPQDRIEALLAVLASERDRRIRLRIGKNYNRGRQYLFHINQQGRDYLEYLRNPEESIRRRNSRSVRDSIDMITISKIRDDLPEEFKPYARIMHDSLLGMTPIRSIERRFPIHRDYGMVMLVGELLKQNHMLRTELSDLQKSKAHLDTLYHDNLEHLERRASEMQAQLDDIKKQQHS